MTSAPLTEVLLAVLVAAAKEGSTMGQKQNLKPQMEEWKLAHPSPTGNYLIGKGYWDGLPVMVQ